MWAEQNWMMFDGQKYSPIFFLTRGIQDIEKSNLIVDDTLLSV